MTLVSDSPAKFTSQLPEQVEVHGDWEVGLSEISFPSLRHNIISTVHYAQIANVRLPLRRGHYDSVVDVLQEVTRGFNLYRRDQGRPEVSMHAVVSREEAQELIKNGHQGFFYIKNLQLVGLGFLAPVRLRFSNALAPILGFSPSVKYLCRRRTLVLGETKADIRTNRPYKTAYIYTDIIEPVIVGDAKVRLLRTADTSCEGGSVVHRIFPAPIYLPLQTKCFDTLEIDIKTDTGRLMPFLTGKSVVVLHFRKVM